MLARNCLFFVFASSLIHATLAETPVKCPPNPVDQCQLGYPNVGRDECEKRYKSGTKMKCKWNDSNKMCVNAFVKCEE